MVHESSRRESVGASTMHQDSPISGAAMDANQEDEVVEVEKNTTRGGRGNNGGCRGRNKGRGAGGTKFMWSHEQDQDLCKSLLTISNNAVVGADQSYGDLWEKIVQYYNRWRTEGPEVDVEKASNHWYKMSTEVSKLNGCYIQVKDTHPSGHDKGQIIEMAIKLWKNRNKTNRNLPYLHSWKILRDQQKWKEFVTKEGSKSKRTKNIVSGAYTSSSSNADTSDTNSVTMMDERPPGQKASKAAARSKGKSMTKKDATETWNKFEELHEKKMAMYQERIRVADFEILFKDTSQMDENT
ncbi:Glutathione S-transferase T3 [Bienertia sinuspersici]